MLKLQKCAALKSLQNQLRPYIATLTASLSNKSLESDQEIASATNSLAIKKGISKAMKVYLERAQQYDAFMKQQKHEFKIGKRHLANMMGEDPETFTQKDIDEAIQYLFPSGLFEPKARPFMKPPEEVFPEHKAAEFDESGRPHHFLFYTGKPTFYKLLFDIVENINELNKFEDTMIRKGIKPDPNVKLDLSGYQWVSKDNFEKLMLEKLNDRDYESFITAMERLCEHPYSYRLKDFVLKYKTHLMAQMQTYEITQPKYDEKGRAYVTTYECRRKTATADVTVISPGEGVIKINGQDLNYFKNIQSREQLLFPLIFTEMLSRVDIEANVAGSGPSAQAGAIRYGIAWSLRSFVDIDMVEKMRIAGLLSRDFRTRERKKPGQAKARKKFTWKKR